MRLINTSSLQLREFSDREVPAYAILSHRWSNEEITFEEYASSHATEKPKLRMKSGYRKILNLCRLAREGVLDREGKVEKFQWAWADTICIDKRSSAELSEAINSMYRWYQMAGVCLVFLPDVTALQSDTADANRDIITVPGHSSFEREQFVHSTWFNSGWTLQELIAPKFVLFYDTNPKTLGSIFKGYPYGMNTSNEAFYTVTAEAARMDWTLLTSRYPVRRAASIASVLCWAAHRRVTRAEDSAYSLLGLCGVNMPLLYGEGGLRAFRRLQLEIISSTSDLSIFAFRQSSQDWDAGILARHLYQFAGSEGLHTDSQRPRVLTRTPRGLELEVRILVA